MSTEDKEYAEMIALYETLTPEEADSVMKFIEELMAQRETSSN